MTAPALSLVSAHPSGTPKKANEAATYSDYDQATIQGYQSKLNEGRYFKLFSAKSPLAWIICGDCPSETLPMLWLCDDLRTYCQETGRKVPNPLPHADYIAYGLKVVVGTRFVPNGSALLKVNRHQYVNTYKKFEPEHPPVPLSMLFHQFIECMFPDQVERHTFLQFVGHMFQHPEERTSWHPMILSETGTGKGFLYEAILNPLLCDQTRLLKKYSELTGRFADAMKSMLVVLDDCKSKREDQQTQLKSLMTEERVLLEEKNGASGMVVTYARFFLFTNEEVPLELDESERRWWIPKRLTYSHGLTGDEGRKDRKRNVIQPLADWLKQDGALEAVYKFFMEYDLTGFDPKSPPMTDTLREQIAKSETPEQAFASDFLTNNEMKVVKAEELSRAFTDSGMNKPSNQALSKLFAYCEYRPELIKVGEQKLRWWFPVAMSKAEAETILVRDKAEKEAQAPF